MPCKLKGGIGTNALIPPQVMEKQQKRYQLAEVLMRAASRIAYKPVAAVAF